MMQPSNDFPTYEALLFCLYALITAFGRKRGGRRLQWDSHTVAARSTCHRVVRLSATRSHMLVTLLSEMMSKECK